MPDLIAARTLRYSAVSPAEAVGTYEDLAMLWRARARQHVENFTFITESQNKQMLKN